MKRLISVTTFVVEILAFVALIFYGIVMESEKNQPQEISKEIVQQVR
jgi:hypothetical protein